MSLSNSPLRYFPFSLRYCIIAIAAFLCSVTTVSYAQPSQTIGLNDAYATVRDGDGLINWYTTVGNSLLSFQYKSFVSFRFNHNHIYTNNDIPSQVPLPSQSLPNGTISRRGPKSPAGIDTITMTWKNVEGVDIFQDVFAIPVADGTLNPRCQIGVRYRFANNSGGAVEIETQYLLDVAVAGHDGAKTLTRHGYKQWARYGRGEPLPMPPFFINFENELPNAPTYDPGISGQGWFINQQFGINPPYRVTIGHWPTLERISWGSPSPLPPPPADPTTFDNSILMEWDGVTVNAKDTITGPSFTYGTGDFQSCTGKLFALLFVPRKLIYDKPRDRYVPNPFTLDVYLFNPEKNVSASNVQLKLDVGQNLTIVGVPAPSKTETVTPNPSSINPLEVTAYSWQIMAQLNRPCTGPIFADMTLSAVSSLGPPSFIDVCSPTIELPCTELDILPPIVDNIKGTEPDLIQSFDVHDDRTDDKGLQKIDYVVTVGNPANFRVTIGTISPCTKLMVPVSITQIDSQKGGCLEFTYTDCAGNFLKKEFCFMAHDTVATPDTLKPIFNLLERVGSDNGTDCNALRDSIEVTEKRDHDKGLASVTLTTGVPPVNMRLVSDPITSLVAHRFSVEVIDRFQNGSISVTATDLAGNKEVTDYTFCTIKDTIAPRIDVSPMINNKWTVTVVDNYQWDRLINEIILSAQTNVRVNPLPTTAMTQGQPTFSFEVEVIDTSKPAGFCVYATDLAGNRSGSTCPTNNPPKDVFPPVIGFTPALSTNPWKVTVNINDVHYRNNDSVNGRVPYDTGIDSIWFSGNNGMNVGTAARQFSPTVMQVPLFTIEVIDTNDAINETACVTIHARDSASNITTTTWCYPIKSDTLAPLISGVGATNADIDLVVTDEQLLDRGLRRVDLLTPDNFQAFTPIVVTGDKSTPVKLQLANNSKSATGRVQAMDMWGSNATRPEIKEKHTSWIDVAMWVQAFRMKKSHLIAHSGEFMLPVFIDPNDAYPVSVKGINQYEFTFRITGDPQVTFVRAETGNTSSLNWTVSPIITNGGRDVTIRAVAPAGQVMDYSDSNIVIKLIFTGAESEFSKTALIEMVSGTEKNVLFNDGKQSTVTGVNATAILPAPQGSVNGASIVVAGTCTPLTTAGAGGPKTSTIEMGPVIPNPLTGNGRVHFGLPKTARANLKLFNAVGEAVLTIADAELEAGDYEQSFDISGISGGTYYLRLESAGEVVTRIVKITR